MKIRKLVQAALRGNTWFSPEGLKELKRKDFLWIAWLAFWGIALAASFFIYYIINLYQGLFQVGLRTGRDELLFFYSILASWIFIFLISIPLALSVLYYAKDIHLLLVLPITSLDIILSRIFLLYLYCLPLHTFITGSAFFVYGANMGFPLWLWPGVLINVLAGPLFPLSLAIVLVVFLGKLIHLGKYKTVFEVGGMFFGLGLVVGFQLFISRSFMEPDQLFGFPGIMEYIDKIMAFFFPAAWVARSFFPQKNILYLFLSLLLYCTVFFLMLMAMKVFYLHDVRKQGVSTGRKKRRKQYIYTEQEPTGKVYALFKKELKILFSNSTFIFQTIGELAVFPIMLLIFAVLLPSTYSEALIALIPSGPLASLLILGLCIAFTSFNSMSCTSLSREGQSFALSLIIPVSGKTQVLSKLLLHLIFYVPVFFIDMSILMIFMKADIVSLVYMVPGACVFLIFSFIISITIDLKRPILHWTHPMQAVKNNLNVLINLGISLGYMALFGGAGWACLQLLRITPVFFGSGLVLVVGILDILLLPRVFRAANREYGGGIEML